MMVSRNSFAIALIAVIMVAAGCGGGGSHQAAPPATGPFSTSSLNGTYSFALTGNNTFGFLGIAGSFNANGSGTITGGTIDVNSGNGVFLNQSVNGTYTVRSNGQAAAVLNTPVGTFDIDFVLISTQRGLIIRFDNNSSASGTIDLQSSAAFTLAALAGQFTFNVSGIDAGGNAETAMGNFNVDSSGNITSGVQDSNDAGTPITNIALTPTTAAMSAPVNGRGLLTINSGAVLHFVYYVVDATHLKLVETDAAPVMTGDAFRQTGPFSNASVNGPFAFTIAGSVGVNPFVQGGVAVSNGAGNITSGTQDVNNGGAVTQAVSFTGTYAIAANGRGTLTVNSALGTSTFVAYPSSGGVQLMEIDVGVVTSGLALNQTGTFSNASISGPYGLTFTGVTSNGEIDSVSQFTASGSGTLSGGIDFNNGGVLTSGLALSGTYTVAANGRGTASLQSTFGTQHVVVYLVTNTRFLLVDVDNTLVAVGQAEHQ